MESDKLNGAQRKRLSDLLDITEKLDGVYSLVTVVATPDGTQVRHWGRSGKALSNTGILDDRVLRHSGFLKNTVLISEITSRDPLAKLSGYLTPSRVNDGDFVPTDMEDNFHDVLHLVEFVNGRSYFPYRIRKHMLATLLYRTGLRVVRSEGVMSLEKAKVLADEKFFPSGKEGLIGRDLEADWVAGARNEAVIKIKEKLSYDVTVVGMCSGKDGSKYQETLGKLYVLFRAFGKPDGAPLIIPISGMTDAQRDLWWNDESIILGKTVKMDAKSFTEEGNLREPRFKEVREDKSSDFPCTVFQEAHRFTKGKAYHMIHNIKVR